MASSRRRSVRTRGGAPRWRWWLGCLGLLLFFGVGIGIWWWLRHPSPALTSPVPAAAPPVVVPSIPPPPPVSLPAAAPVSPSIVAPVVKPIVTSNPPAAVPPGPSVKIETVRIDPLQPVERSDRESVVDLGSRPATNWLQAQLALISRGISTGPIDGVGGAQTTEALRAFQFDNRLEANGRLDRETTAVLLLKGPVWREWTVTAAELKRLRPMPTTWLGKSQAPALEFESMAELVGEATQTHPGYLRQLNPGVDWTAVPVGQRLKVPAAEFPPAQRAGLLRISLGRRWIRAFDGSGKLLAHFPCSIAARVEKRPVGALSVAVVVKNPNYTFDPATFPESAEARSLGRRLILPPGPNNPVGVAWMGLDRPGYGIHGTPVPEQVGRTESHGCFRLANWNADYLRQLSWVGLRVNIEP